MDCKIKVNSAPIETVSRDWIGPCIVLIDRPWQAENPDQIEVKIKSHWFTGVTK
jgi:hypothetical protein